MDTRIQEQARSHQYMLSPGPAIIERLTFKLLDEYFLNLRMVSAIRLIQICRFCLKFAARDKASLPGLFQYTHLAAQLDLDLLS